MRRKIHEKLPPMVFIWNSSLPFLEKIIIISTNNDKGLNRGQALFQVPHIFSFNHYNHPLRLVSLSHRLGTDIRRSSLDSVTVAMTGGSRLQNNHLGARTFVLNRLGKTYYLSISLEMHVIINSMGKKGTLVRDP